MAETATETHSPVQHVLVDRVSWADLIQFPKLARAGVIALQPGRILMGFALIIILVLSGAAYDQLFFNPPSFPSAEGPNVPRGQLILLEETDGPFKRASDLTLTTLQSAVNDLTELKFITAISQVLTLPFDLGTKFYEEDRTFLFVFGIYFLFLWCIGSAAICRSAAFEFALKQQIHWTDALAFSLKRWTSTVGSLALPLLLILVAVLILGVGGMLLRVPGLDIVAALLFGLALFGGFVIVCVKLLTIFGAVLFIPAVAVDSADAPDALARGFSYVKNRPLHYFFYLFSAIFLGLVIFTVVVFLANQTITWTAATAETFLESDLAKHANINTSPWVTVDPQGTTIAPTGTTRMAAWIISCWGTLVWVFVAGFVVSYLCSAQTVIYFLMRKATDDQDLDEIWIDGMIEGTLAPSRPLRNGSE